MIMDINENLWTKEKSFQEALILLEKEHDFSKVVFVDTKVLGFGFYKGKNLLGNDLHQDWFELFIRYSKKDSDFDSTGFAKIPASLFLEWGIIDNLDELLELENFLNSSDGLNFIRCIIQEHYYV